MLLPHLWLRSTGFPFRWVDELALPGCADAAAFAREMPEVRKRLVARMTGQDVTEALVLSSVDAVDRMAALADADLSRVTLRTRQRLRLAWSYLQRLCTKNETCSFFGPLALGTVDPAAAEDFSTSLIDPAGSRLHRRSVRVEHWALRGLGDALVSSGELEPPYRLHAACDLEGDDLLVPLGKRIRGAGRHVRALLSGQPIAEQTLRRLVAAGAVRREIPVPPGGTALPAHPVVDRLETLRARFERRTDADSRRALIGELRAVLADAGVDPVRAAGTMYAGRLPVYEDCERNVRFRVGGRLARTLLDDLPPLLRLYRVVAQCAASELHEHYRSGVTEDFPTYLRAVRTPSVIEPVLARITGSLRAVLNEAWARFGPAEEITLDDSDLAAVADVLRSRFPGWDRHADVLGVGLMSPDVLPAQDGTVVLGEVHPCVLAALQPVTLPFLDSSHDVLAPAVRELCGGRTVLAPTDRTYQRSQFTWPVTASLAEVVVPGATSRCPDDRTIPAGRGRVRLVDGVVRFTDRETGRDEDMVTVLSSDLQRVMFGVAGAVIGGDLTARIRYRDVVARRRSWRAPAPPPASRPAEDFASFAALRDWARKEGLPRRVFVHAGGEPKPIYVDWASPFAVDAFVRVAKDATALRVTEFAPEPWFTDDLGTHTAELRMTYAV